MDCIAHGVAKSRTRLSDFHFQQHERDAIHVRIVKNFAHVSLLKNPYTTILPTLTTVVPNVNYVKNHACTWE